LTLLGYGPVPGVELIPYFLALLAWVGLAFLSVLLSPITALFRLFRRGKSGRQEANGEVKSKPEPPSVSAAAAESRHD
jgi:hypothetical protein